MATYIGFHEVDDVDHWLHSPKRQELFGRMGITGQLFTDTAKSNRVGLILEIPDMEAFQQLLESEAGTDAMKFDGVRPETIAIFERHPTTCKGLRGMGRRERWPMRQPM